MITTRFLATKDFHEYGTWMKSQSADDKHMFFGYAVQDQNIDALITKMTEHEADNYILVAENAAGVVGSLHIAITGAEVEFGLMVAPEHRGHGIASIMMEEALLWTRNRGYSELFMHCLTVNHPVQRLCRKYNLKTSNEYGESETKVKLPPPNLMTVTQEVAIRQKQAWRLLLRSTWPAADLYG